MKRNVQLTCKNLCLDWTSKEFFVGKNQDLNIATILIVIYQEKLLVIHRLYHFYSTNYYDSNSTVYSHPSECSSWAEKTDGRQNDHSWGRKVGNKTNPTTFEFLVETTKVEYSNGHRETLHTSCSDILIFSRYKSSNTIHRVRGWPKMHPLLTCTLDCITDSRTFYSIDRVRFF